MKHILSNSLHALLLTAALTAGGIAQAQTIEATRTTVTSDGIVSEFGPQGLLIKTAVDSQPIRYISTDTTNYVDELGNPVSASLVTAGVPTTVYYTKVGDRLIVSKVMVKTGAVAARVVTPAVTETTTYSEGTVTDFGGDRIVLRSQSSAQPMPYTYTKTTSYVDEAGAPIAVDTVRSGVPVTVYYVKGADGSLIASKVVVRRAAAVAVPVPPVVETQRTTTTTTVPVRRDNDDDDN